MIQRPFVTINMEAAGKNIQALRKKNHYTVKDLQEYFGFEYPQAIYKRQWGQCNVFTLIFKFNVNMICAVMTLFCHYCPCFR